MTQTNQAQIQLRSGRISEAKAAADEGCNKTSELLARDPTVTYWRLNGRTCLALRAELAAIAGAKGEALSLAQQALDAVKTEKSDGVRGKFALGQAHKLIGDIRWRTGDRVGARAAWKNGLAAWPKGIPETPRQLSERGEMLRGIGQRAEGMRIASQLAAMGYRQSLSNRARM